MWRLRRRDKADGGGVAAAEGPLGTDELFGEIGRLTRENRERPTRDTERQLLQLRHQAGMRRLAESGAEPEHAQPDAAALPDAEGGLPEIEPAQLTAGLMRAGILRDGGVLVRGLVDRDAALEMADGIDRSFAARETLGEGGAPEPGLYEEFAPDERYAMDVRPWIQAGGGVLAVDSPTLSFQMMELFDSAGLPRLVADYLGEPAIMSANKSTLRKAEPSVDGAWHQDGAFMGSVRALNLWLSLSRCGDESPGLDIVPRRLEEIVSTGTEGTVVSFQVSHELAEEAAGDNKILRPIFEPGDALFFDDLFLHQTGSDPSMPKPRFAIENWFFGASAFPDDYAPVAV